MHKMNDKFNKLLTTASLACLIFAISSAWVNAADWPTYMNDNARSGVTYDLLDIITLSTQSWVYSASSVTRTAWGGPAPWDAFRNKPSLAPMRDFDKSAYVTVVGNKLYIGSSVDDSVVCLNAATGAELWAYVTGGPVRFPPSHDSGKLYFGSDDGYAYCVDADTGALIWKYTPIPAADQKLICNNGNLIPMWPVRTGVAVYDGKAYFASGLVPWKSSYLCAVDASTGSDSGTGLYKVSGGKTPMGAILVSSTKIYLSQGRTAPYCYDRTTGASIGQLGQNASNGGSFALLTQDSPSRFVRGTGLRSSDQSEISEFNADTRDFIAGNSAAKCMVVEGTNAYIVTGTNLKSLRRSDGGTEWTVPCDTTDSLIWVNNLLFAGGDGKVAAYSTTDGSELWTATVEGNAVGLAAASLCLYVSTDSGKVYAYQADPDFDDDGIDDAWEMNNFGSISTCNASSDADGDGYSDYSEFVAGTQPTNSASLLTLSRANIISDSAIELSWPSQPTKNYTVKYKTNLLANLWQPLTSYMATPPINTSTVTVRNYRTGFFLIEVQ